MLTCIPPHLRDEVTRPHLSDTRNVNGSGVVFNKIRGVNGSGVVFNKIRGKQRGHWSPLSSSEQSDSSPTSHSIMSVPAFQLERWPCAEDEKRSPTTQGEYGMEKGRHITSSLPVIRDARRARSAWKPNGRQLVVLWMLVAQLVLLLYSSLSSSSTSRDRSRLASVSSGITAITPLAPEFVANCHSLLTPPEGTYTSRLHRLTEILEEDTVFITEPSPTADFLIGGFSLSDWWLSERPFLIAISSSPKSDKATSPTSTPNGNRITLLTPSFEALRASLIALPDEVKSLVDWVEWREDQSPYEVLASHVRGKGIKHFVLDDKVRQFVARGLRDVMKEDVEGMKYVRALRERKTEWEIGLLRCANQFTLQAIRETRGRMFIGVTESETSEILEEEMSKTGLIGGEGLVLFGENAALPHGSGTDRKLRKADFVLIDAGGTYGGYVSDITRTFALPDSEIPKEHIALWETVRRAQLAPYELLSSSHASKEGELTFGELDKAARSVVSQWKNDGKANDASTGTGTATADEGESSSQPDFSIFTHRLGHGIGLEGHESPYLVQGPLGKQALKEGNMFSLEPGIYLPSTGSEVNGLKGVGVRLEDCFVLLSEGEGGWKGEWLSGPVGEWGDI